MLNSCAVCILLVLLEVINKATTRPQLMRPPLASSDTFIPNGTIAYKKPIKRSAAKPFTFGKENKTKEERILNRGPISFGQYSEQDIIFPDSFEILFEPVPRIDGPPKCADGNTFCETFDSYPYLHLKDILQREGSNKEVFFGEDVIPTELKERVGIDDEMFVCGATDRIIFPKIGKNKNSEWKYIVNQGRDEGFVQGVHVETCVRHGGPCDIIGELPDGYRTACKQKYVYRRMLSLSDKGSTVPDSFQLPSACCCSYKRDVDFLARFGAPFTPANIKKKNASRLVEMVN